MHRFGQAAVVSLLVLSPGTALAAPVFSAPSYTSSLVLTGTASGGTAASAAFDGSSYYLGYGGSSNSPIVRDNAAGAVTGGPVTPTPGIDFRSLFTDASGNVFARGFASNVIYRQTSFGQFTSALTLQGSIDDQEQIVRNGSGYVGNNNGVLQFWNASGALTGTVTLQGFDTGYPQGRAVSIFNGYALNYDAGVLFAYSLTTGALVDQTTLVGAGSSFNSYYGQSYANGYFFVPTTDGSQFIGYRVGAANPAVPEPATWAMMIAGFSFVGAALRAAHRPRRLSVA